MEVVTIEKRTFSYVCEQFTEFAKRIECPLILSILMKRTKEDYPSFNLFSIVGTWESVNLNPTVIIYRNDKEYLLSIIYVSETTKQASPATYEIQQDGSQYFIATASKRLSVDYDPAKDVLSISSLGDYLRN